MLSTFWTLIFTWGTAAIGPEAHANTWGMAGPLCEATRPIKLYKDPGRTEFFYQAQKGDLIACTGDAAKGYVLNGSGKVQPNLYAEPGAETAFRFIPKNAPSRQANFVAKRKQTSVMNEPDASWVDRDEKVYPREWVMTLDGNPDKVIFVRGSQIVQDFVDPYDQSHPDWRKDPWLRDKRPELMYQVEVVDRQYVDRFLKKQLTEEEIKAHVRRGWTRADFLSFKPEEKIEGRHITTTRKNVPAQVELPKPPQPSCTACPPSSSPTERHRQETAKALMESLIDSDEEQRILADLDQMRKLSCGGSLQNFDNYSKLWHQKYGALRVEGKLKSRVSRQQLFAIDAMARTMYGELLWPKICTEKHWLGWSRIVHNRAQEERAGIKDWAEGNFKGKPLEEIIPHIVGGKTRVNGKGIQQYHVWKPNDKNQRKMGCVLNTDDWDIMVNAATRTVLGNGKAIVAMTSNPTKGKNGDEYDKMDNVKCYYSGVPGKGNPCGGRDVRDLKVNGYQLISDPSEYQCLVPTTDRT